MAFTEKYVTNSGAGAADGSSLANAWSWATMLTTLAAGQRANVQGAITRTGLLDVFSNVGTAANPMSIRGINSTPGDLEANGRTRGGALITTNFPVVTYTTGRLVIPAGTLFEHMSITSARSGYGLDIPSSSYIRRCVSANTHASGSACAGINLGGSAEDCDFSCISSSSTAYAVTGGLFIHNCLISGTNSGCGGILAGVQAKIIGCMIRDVSFGIVAQGYTDAVLCAFRNITGAYVKNTGNHVRVSNSVAWGSGGSSQWYNSGGTTVMHCQFNNFIGNMGAADADEGNWPVYNETALTADPFTSSADLTLNNTAGGGAVVRGAGYPAYIDGGAWQHQDAAAGGGIVVPTSNFGGESCRIL